MSGGGGGQMQSTTVTSNIPEYARPYVENMLGAAQQQIFTPDTQGNYTGFKPYTPYSTDPTKYFAAPTSAQNQAYGQAMGLSTPTQFDAATGLGNLAGMGQLGLTQNAGAYGQAGAGFGAQAANQAQIGFGSADKYENTVTNPDEFSKYMSPYTQQIINPQLAQAQRDYEIQNSQANLAAARQGTYGGARQALKQIELEKGLNMQKSNIIGQGLQNAYDRAQQSIQYGAGLGLQGLQAGYQGLGMGMQGAQLGLQGVGAQQQGLAGAANTAAIMGQLGAGQQNTDLSRIQALSSLGSAQQQYQQGIINQAVQDYATSQQYPYMQLGTMSSLLRGLPIQNMTTQQYVAQPSIIQQGAGLLGAYGAYKGAFKEGGAVKKYDVGGSIENKLDKMQEADPTNKGLMGLAAKTQSPELKRMIATKIMESQPVRMAAGGKAKDAEEDVPDPVPTQAPVDPLRQRVERLGETYRSMGVPVPGQGGPKQQALMNLLESHEAQAGKYADEDSRLRKAMAFLEFGSTPFGPLRGALEGGKSYLAGEMQARMAQKQAALQRAQMMAGVEGQNVGAAQNMIGSAQTILGKEAELAGRNQRHMENMQNRLDVANSRNAATLQAAGIRAAGTSRPTDFDKQFAIIKQDLVGKGHDPNDPNTDRVALDRLHQLRNIVPQQRVDASTYNAAMTRLASNAKRKDMMEMAGQDTRQLDALIAADQNIVDTYKQQANVQGAGLPSIVGNNYMVGGQRAVDMIPGTNLPQSVRPNSTTTSTGETVYLHPDGNYYDQPPR